MTFIHKQAVIIGGGPGGLAAAAELKKNGIDDILILEREHTPGGILRQCIHDGFGLTRFGETLSGPEYAQRFIDDVKKQGIEIVTDATVIGLTQDRKVTAASKDGLLQYQADALMVQEPTSKASASLASAAASDKGVNTTFIRRTSRSGFFLSSS